MSEITLQEYQNEIDQLIDESRYLEALAHLRHILKQYPRYFEAYYLLGKTMLDADLPELAIDMFRRALSANPEHLVSRIGLGLAHERRDDLDAAIWNLERALEIDPGNEDIADEIRRMVGRRDGVEPDFIPQTQAGLAHLYIRGNRYGRAAEELRALLEVEPSRPDLLTALAEAYWRDEQYVQASEVCQNILDTMPHNCKANLLLGSLWMESGQSEGRVFLESAQDVDPEGHIASALFGADSPVEANPVTLERLTYEPDAMEVDRETRWFQRLEAASVTVGISEAPPEMTESEVRLVDITAGLESQIEIPDWLRDIGVPELEEEAGGDLDWMSDLVTDEEEEELEVEAVEDVEEVSPEAVEFAPAEEWEAEVPETTPAVEEPAEPMSEAAMPETEGEAFGWLQGLTEETDQSLPEDVDLEEAADWLSDLGIAEETVAAGEVEVGDEAPDWLQELVAGSEMGQAETAEAEVTEAQPDLEVEAEAPVEADEMPDWLSELEPSAEEATDEEALAPAEDVPDWLGELEPAGGDEEAAEGFPLPEEGAPDWLSELQAGEAEVAEEVPKEAEVEELVEGEAGEAEVPDWLSALEPEATEGEAAEAVSAEGDVEVAGEVPDWLRDFKPETLEEAAEAEAEEEAAAPLEAAEAESLGFDVAETEVPETEMTLPDEQMGQPSEGAAPDLAEAEAGGGILGGDEALSWLESLTVGKEEELRAQAEAEAEARTAEILGRKPKREPEPEEPEVAEQVEEVTEAVQEVAPAEQEIETGAEVAAEPAPAEAEEPSMPEMEGDMLSGDDALAWLESFTVGKEEELRAQAEAESEARMAELLGRKKEEAEAPEPEPTPEEEVPEDEAVAGMAAEPETPEVAAEAETLIAESPEAEVPEPAEEVPDWLDQLQPTGAEEEPAEAVAFEEETDTDWLSQFGDVSADEAAEVEAPETMLSEAETYEPEAAEMEALLEGEGVEEEDVLGWLAGVEAEEMPLETEAEAELESETAEEVAADVPDWLEAFRSGPLADLDEAATLIEEPADTSETEVVEVPEEPVAEAVDEEDALSWLEGLAAAEAEEEALPQPEPEVEAAPAPELEPEAEMLSGDDALAWLESLTVGKEDELRAQAEVEAEARTAEILGRKREAVEEVEAPSAEAEPETASVEPVQVEEEPPSGEDALGWLESLAAEAEEVGAEEPTAEELAQEEITTEELATEEIATEELATEEIATEAEPESVVEPMAPADEDVGEVRTEAPAEPEPSEDALSWLDALSPEETEDIESEIEAQAAARMDDFETTADREMPDVEEIAPEQPPAPERLEAEPFGWTAFASQAVPGEGEVAEEAEVAFGFTHFDDVEDMPEPEAEALEVEQQAEAALQAEVEAELPPEDIPVGAQPVTEIEALPEAEDEIVEPPVEPPVEVGAESVGAESVGAESVGAESAEPEMPIAEPEVSEEPRPAAQVSEVTGEELDEMRAYTESHEDDEGARLALARALWQADEVDEAMKHYEELVESRDKMDEVLTDMERYYEARPQSGSLLRTLGDAYMKEGNLDRALEFYNRAMDLL